MVCRPRPGKIKTKTRGLPHRDDFRQLLLKFSQMLRSNQERSIEDHRSRSVARRLRNRRRRALDGYVSELLKNFARDVRACGSHFFLRSLIELAFEKIS